MKRFFLVTILMIVSILFISTVVYGYNANFVLACQDEVETGSTNTINISIVSDKKIGGIMGVIEKTSNITDVELVKKNGWDITYNKETGNFNMIKNEGADSGEIMEIKYTVSNNEGKAKIELKDIVVSEIEAYEEKELDTISQEIKIVKGQTNKKDDDPQPENPSQNENNTNISNTSKDTSKDTLKDTSKTDNQKVATKNENATSGKTSLPKTGIATVIIPISILLLGIAGVVMFSRYKKYKGIK